jgi:hypothetical protein
MRGARVRKGGQLAANRGVGAFPREAREARPPRARPRARGARARQFRRNDGPRSSCAGALSLPQQNLRSWGEVKVLLTFRQPPPPRIPRIPDRPNFRATNSPPATPQKCVTASRGGRISPRCTLARAASLRARWKRRAALPCRRARAVRAAEPLREATAVRCVILPSPALARPRPPSRAATQMAKAAAKKVTVKKAAPAKAPAAVRERAGSSKFRPRAKETTRPRARCAVAHSARAGPPPPPPLAHLHPPSLPPVLEGEAQGGAQGEGAVSAPPCFQGVAKPATVGLPTPSQPPPPTTPPPPQLVQQEGEGQGESPAAGCAPPRRAPRASRTFF